MNELKPCPFCGNEAAVKAKRPFSKKLRTTYVACIYVQCEGCLAEIGVLVANGGNLCERIDAAVEKWNIRE